MYLINIYIAQHYYYIRFNRKYNVDFVNVAKFMKSNKYIIKKRIFLYLSGVSLKGQQLQGTYPSNVARRNDAILGPKKTGTTRSGKTAKIAIFWRWVDPVGQLSSLRGCTQKTSQKVIEI